MLSEAGKMHLPNHHASNEPVHGRLLVSFLILALLVVLPAVAQDYEVDGKIEQTIFDRSGKTQITRGHFTVFVRSNCWLIQTTDYAPNGKPLVTRETACSNGTVIYELTQSIKSPIIDWWRTTIVTNDVPVDTVDSYYVCHLWLMFASGSYFAKLSTNRLTPAYDSNASVAVNPNLKREAQWDLLDGPGSLPFAVNYLDQERAISIRASDNERWSSFRYPKNASYLATGVTNIGKLKIPTGFMFEVRVNGTRATNFGPGRIFAGESLPVYRIRKYASASVTAVRPFCSRDEFVSIPQRNRIVTEKNEEKKIKRILYYPSENFTTKEAGDVLEFRISGKAGHAYIVHSTTNLVPPVNWQAVFTNRADTTGKSGFSITNQPGMPEHFYRVRDALGKSESSLYTN